LTIIVHYYSTTSQPLSNSGLEEAL